MKLVFMRPIIALFLLCIWQGLDAAIVWGANPKVIAAFSVHAGNFKGGAFYTQWHHLLHRFIGRQGGQ